MKKILKVTTLSIALSSVLFAGGNIESKDVEMATAPVVPVVEKAASRFYVGAALGFSSNKSELYKGKEVSGVLVAGYDINDYIGFEARYIKGLKRIDDLGLDYFYGVYLKPQYRINKRYKVYGLAGYGKTKIKLKKSIAQANNVIEYTKQKGFSFGGGVEYKINQKVKVFIDATQLINKSTTRPEGKYKSEVYNLAVGVKYSW